MRIQELNLKVCKETRDFYAELTSCEAAENIHEILSRVETINLHQEEKLFLQCLAKIVNRIFSAKLRH